jgi:hypothetical protein
VETGRPETTVSYASDLDVCTFGSGFCAPPEASVPANRQDSAAAAAVHLGSKAKAGSRGPVVSADAHFDYSRTAWNCLNLPTAKVGGT